MTKKSPENGTHVTRPGSESGLDEGKGGGDGSTPVHEAEIATGKDVAPSGLKRFGEDRDVLDSTENETDGVGSTRLGLEEPRKRKGSPQPKGGKCDRELVYVVLKLLPLAVGASGKAREDLGALYGRGSMSTVSDR